MKSTEIHWKTERGTEIQWKTVKYTEIHWKTMKDGEIHWKTVKTVKSTGRQWKTWKDRYLLEAAPPAVGDSGLHPAGQSQQLVVSLPPLGLLLPPLLAVLRVWLVLPLQAAPLAGLRRLLGRPASPVIAALVFSARGRRAAVVIFVVVIVVFAPQERALPAGRAAKWPLKYTTVPYLNISLCGISAGWKLSGNVWGIFETNSHFHRAVHASSVQSKYKIHLLHFQLLLSCIISYN